MIRKIAFFLNLLQKYLVVEIFCCTFATQLRVATYWTFSSAGLEHLPYKQRVGGSNPSTSTKPTCAVRRLFFCLVAKFYSKKRQFVLFLINFMPAMSVYG